MFDNFYETLTSEYVFANALASFAYEAKVWKTPTKSRTRRNEKGREVMKDQALLEPLVRKTETSESEEIIPQQIIRTQSKTKQEKSFKFPKFTLINEKDIGSTDLPKNKTTRKQFEFSTRPTTSNMSQNPNMKAAQPFGAPQQMLPSQHVHFNSSQNAQQPNYYNQTQHRPPAINSQGSYPVPPPKIQGSMQNSMSPHHNPQIFTLPSSGSSDLYRANQQFQQKIPGAPQAPVMPNYHQGQPQQPVPQLGQMSGTQNISQYGQNQPYSQYNQYQRQTPQNQYQFQYQQYNQQINRQPTSSYQQMTHRPPQQRPEPKDAISLGRSFFFENEPKPFVSPNPTVNNIIPPPMIKAPVPTPKIPATSMSSSYSLGSMQSGSAGNSLPGTSQPQMMGRPGPNFPIPGGGYQQYNQTFQSNNSIANSNSYSPLQRQNSSSSQNLPAPYINKEVISNKYGLISNQNQNVPVILDQSDKSIKLTVNKDQNNSDQQNSKIMLDWNNLVFENEKYYTTIDDKNSGRMSLDLQHSNTATNFYLIEPHPKNVETQHHPNLDVEKILGKPLTVTFEYDEKSDRTIEYEEQVSSYLRNMDDLSGNLLDLLLLPCSMQNLQD